MTMPEWFPKNPEYVWKHFYDLTQIPRPSKNEGKVVEYLIQLAKEHNLEYRTDNENNVVIYVPATKGFENKEPVIIQGHVDMVTDATPDREIDFNNDPIATKLDGDWLTADRTTLGADNGIGCAMALACITDKSVEHPPLELLFTTDEETGLNGAWAVESDFFKGRKLINIDTEEWGSLYVGCAGGIDYDLQGEFPTVSPQTPSFYKLTLGGLTGGHSGLDIHLQLGNAIKLLSQGLARFANENTLEISEFRGGRAHNIIPRDAFAVIGINDKSALESFLTNYNAEILTYLPKRDHSLEFSFEEVEKPSACLSTTETSKFLNTCTIFPHGADNYEMPLEKELVSSSNNFAKCLLVEGKFYAMSSLRFFDRNEVKMIEDKLHALAMVTGFKLTKNSEYPSWKPFWDTPLLNAVKQTYKEVFNNEAKVKAIHAGLECGILKDRISDELDAISFGPDITGAHSPDERVNIPSVEKTWVLLKETLKRL